VQAGLLTVNGPKGKEIAASGEIGAGFTLYDVETGVGLAFVKTAVVHSFLIVMVTVFH
jgi:hypothetical protein